MLETFSDPKGLSVAFIVDFPFIRIGGTFLNGCAE